MNLQKGDLIKFKKGNVPDLAEWIVKDKAIVMSCSKFDKNYILFFLKEGIKTKILLYEDEIIQYGKSH